jgi:hypothetical protein
MQFGYSLPRGAAQKTFSQKFASVSINSKNSRSIVFLQIREEKIMAAQNPKKNMDLLDQAFAAWNDYAPEKTFGGKQLSDLQTAVTTCKQDRGNIVNAENEMRGLIITRDNHDEDALLIREFLVNGVIGDPDFGPDSAFYEALGYVRKSERKSGLTRKKNQPAD